MVVLIWPGDLMLTVLKRKFPSFKKCAIYYIKLTLWPCIRFHLDFNPRWFLTYNLTYLRSSSFRLDLGPKKGPKLGQKCQKFKNLKKDRNVKCLVFQLII